MKYTIPAYNGSPDTVGPLVFGDFSHDGSLDILAFTIDSGKACIYHNNGNGAYTSIGHFQAVPAGGAFGSISAVVADFNHDGNLDVAFDHDSQRFVHRGQAANPWIYELEPLRAVARGNGKNPEAVSGSVGKFIFVPGSLPEIAPHPMAPKG